jgi:hypothetical protein
MSGSMVARRSFESLKHRMICCGWGGDDGSGESVARLAEERHRLPPRHDAGGALTGLKRDTL